MESGPLRLFVAISPPPAAKGPLVGALEAASAIAPGSRIVPVENLHLTLLFLGATPAARLPELEGALQRIAAASAPFELALQGAGSFGRRSRPKVLYAGIREGSEAIKSLAARTQAALGAEPEARFTPHVTLARARGTRGDPDLARARDTLTTLSSPPSAVRAMALFESEVSQRGARYRILMEAPFPT